MTRRSRSLALAAPVLALLVALPAYSQVEDWRQIQYPPPPAFKFPTPTVYALKNGMTVFLMEDHELPLITVTARIRTGSDWEPAEKTGLASLAGQVERTGGTARMKGDEIDEFLAARAASVETSIDDDSGFASMNCLKQDLDDVFRVFRDVLREPAFAQDKLDLAKVQAQTAIARRNDNVGAIVGREFPRLVYGKDSPLGRIDEYATIAAITRDDLVAWHAKYYVPNDVYLGVVGDFDPADMRKKIEAAFGDWKKGAGFTPSPIPFRKEPAPGIWFVEKSDVNQANIVMGHLGIEISNPDYFAVQVMNEVLGGGFSSRMFSNVRSKKGLAYNVYGGVGSDYLVPGVFRAGLQTESGKMSQAVEAVKAEVRGIIDNPPTGDELKRAKDSILNSFVFNYDSKAKILRQQMTYRFYGLPADFLDRYQASIEKVTAEDVARVARKYVHPDELTMLVVGKSADFDKPVAALGPKVASLDIAIPPPPGPPTAKVTAATAEEGRTLFARTAAAILGGNVGSLRGYREVSSIAASTPMGPMTIKQSTLFVFPAHLREERQMSLGTITLVWDGKEGYIQSPNGVQPLPEWRKAAIPRQTAGDLYFLASQPDDPSLTVSSAGTEEVGGVSCRVLQLQRGPATMRLWIDPRTYLPVRESYSGTGQGGVPATLDAYFSGWKTLGGVTVPGTITVKADGKEQAVRTIEEFEANPKVEESQFEKPAA